MRELNGSSNPFPIKRKEKKDETREIFSLFNDSDPFGRVICRMQTPNRYDVKS
jgi:hypothetical protein